MTHVDKGTPPDSVQAKKRIEEAVLSGEELEVESAVIEESSVKEVSSYNTGKKDSLHKVILEHNLYTISCGALDISISEHQLAIRLPKTSHFSFEPKVNSSFVVKFLGKSYSVLYLGGVFNFSNDNTWAITFLMDKEEKED